MTPARLSLLQAAFVIARRDFITVLFSRAFLFFLLGPLFPIVVGAMAGAIGVRVTQNDRPVIAVTMTRADRAALFAAHEKLSPQLGSALPDLAPLDTAEGADPATVLAGSGSHWVAVLGGTVKAPVLTGPKDAIAHWRGPVSVLAGEAASSRSTAALPTVALSPVATSSAKDSSNRILTAQAAQTVLFLLTMLLAGMVLSNLVEEKANKVIEILAAAIPMDAVFLGKLFAMLGVSVVGIAVWGAVGSTLFALGGQSFPALPAPAVGWPMFFALGFAYFAMAYLLLGSVFLAIGGMAATVRDVQTLSMPVTMMQLVVFFFASLALTQPGSTIEIAAMVFPFSSPFVMIARAAQEPELWPHLVALCWQGLAVAVFIKTGATLFRRRVMKSGPAQSARRRWFSRKPATHG